MANAYRIFGIELSPYSVKVRSYFRYKRIPHEWVVRGAAQMAEFQKYAKLPLIPLVVTPDDQGLQDSTPLLEAMERLFPEPGIHPEDPALGFLSALLEEYGDEWGNKPMFHYRWWYEADQDSASERIARANLPDAPDEAVLEMASAVKQRMVPRLSFVGSSAEKKEQREGAFESGVKGEFGGWGRLGPTLDPFLAREVAGLFFPWSSANARALAEGKTEFTVQLEGRPFTQQTQKYHARSLAALKERYAAVPDRTAL